MAEVGSVADAHGLAAAVSGADWPGVEDVVVGHRSVTVIADPAATDLAAMAHDLARIPGVAPDPATTRRLDIPVAFDGPDLDDVAELAGLSREDVVDRLLGSELEVAFLGFLPGFAYLEGLPPALAAVPRRSFAPERRDRRFGGHRRRVRRHLPPDFPGRLAAGGANRVRALRPRGPAVRGPAPR